MQKWVLKTCDEVTSRLLLIFSFLVHRVRSQVQRTPKAPFNKCMQPTSVSNFCKGDLRLNEIKSGPWLASTAFFRLVPGQRRGDPLGGADTGSHHAPSCSAPCTPLAHHRSLPSCATRARGPTSGPQPASASASRAWPHQLAILAPKHLFHTLCLRDIQEALGRV